MSIESSFLIAAVILFRIILKKSPKKSRLFLWALVGTRLLIPFSFKTSFSAVPSQTENLSAVTSAAVKTTAVPQSPGFEGIAFRIWLVGFLTMTAYFILSTAFVYFKVSDGVRFEKNIFLSEKIDSPFAFGFIKPRIFIPYGCDEKTLGYVLNHEKEHIKTFDCITRPLSFMILCVHWFNPFVWAAYLMFDRDIELACDERVLKKLEKKERLSYAEALLNVGIKKKNLAVAPVAFGEFALKERIKSAAAYKKPSMWLSAVSVALCLVFTLLFMTERQPVKQVNEVIEKNTAVLKTPEQKTVVKEIQKQSTEQAAEKKSKQSKKTVTEEETTKIVANQSTENKMNYNSEPVTGHVSEQKTETNKDTVPETVKQPEDFDITVYYDKFSFPQEATEPATKSPLNSGNAQKLSQEEIAEIEDDINDFNFSDISGNTDDNNYDGPVIHYYYTPGAEEADDSIRNRIKNNLSDNEGE